MPLLGHSKSLILPNHKVSKGLNTKCSLADVNVDIPRHNIYVTYQNMKKSVSLSLNVIFSVVNTMFFGGEYYIFKVRRFLIM